jgi:hypothetical protein
MSFTAQALRSSFQFGQGARFLIGSGHYDVLAVWGARMDDGKLPDPCGAVNGSSAMTIALCCASDFSEFRLTCSETSKKLVGGMMEAEHTVTEVGKRPDFQSHPGIFHFALSV